MKSKYKILYLVTDRANLSMEQFKHIITEAIKGGVDIVQLREKNVSDNEYIKIAREIKPITDNYQIPLIINDNILVARKADAAGVHLGQKDCHITKARQILKKSAMIGISIENLEQAKSLNQEEISYAAISPLFQTNTKNDAATPIGIEMTNKIRKIISKPLFAIGGINHKNIKEVLNTDIDGICVVSEIFNADDPQHSAKHIKQLM